MLLLVSLGAKAQVYQYRTYYYEFVAQVGNDGVRKEKSGDGQCYTFTQNSCYESDNEGNDQSLGVLRYVNFANNIYVYSGKAFYGEADYFFSSDYNHLNIKTKAGVTYILKRKVAPSGFIASNHKKIKEQIEIMTTVPVVTVPITTMPETGSSSSSSQRSGLQTEYYDCPSCYGTGNCPICHGSGHTSAIYTGGEMKCPSCRWGRCSSCNGTGKKVRIKR